MNPTKWYVQAIYGKRQTIPDLGIVTEAEEQESGSVGIIGRQESIIK